jgi:hypothetical protein
MQQRRLRRAARYLVAGLISSLMMLGSIATAFAGDAPGPWP